MDFKIIRPAAKDYSKLVSIWEASVRATHHFLPEQYLVEIKMLLPQYLSHTELYTLENQASQIIGFLGILDGKIEMLFVHPDWFGQGAGTQLVHHALRALNVRLVDVNEQNTRAVDFYKKLGYTVMERDDLDASGQPFPILHLINRND
ncbi:MAG: GNAT family N-acetyltransferase [Saprospiraceae bacterium]|nr:GNAT family N-acetyltransferase [Saprospiraceae bacterium]